MLAIALIAASAFIPAALGLMHLYLTFFTSAFNPRDAELEARLNEVSPRLTTEITLGRSQIGFHASHSCGIILFGAVYGYLAMAQSALLFQSPYLLTLGGLFLLTYVVLARVYWFSRPLIGVALSLACYILGIVVKFA